MIMDYERTTDDLPDEVIEYILGLVSPYRDFDNCKVVSKRWHRLCRSKLTFWNTRIIVVNTSSLLKVSTFFSLYRCLSTIKEQFVQSYLNIKDCLENS